MTMFMTDLLLAMLSDLALTNVRLCSILALKVLVLIEKNKNIIKKHDNGFVE